jgi:predicted SAM-dependent methyltransferase
VARRYQEGEIVKLNLGCGRKKWEGFVNVDLSGADLNCDIRRLPLLSETVEEIAAIHVVEHFFLTEVADVLLEWCRVLKNGGRLVIEMPCWDKVQEHIKRGSDENMTRWPLYGDPSTHKDGLPALHKWCYSSHEMREILELTGFSQINEEPPRFHQPTRDMRFVAIK